MAWLWMLLVAFTVPELGTLFRSIRICFFKSWRRPPFLDFALIFLMETLHTVGVALLVFVVLRELDVVKGAMLTNSLCLVPGVLGMLSRTNKESQRFVKVRGQSERCHLGKYFSRKFKINRWRWGADCVLPLQVLVDLGAIVAQCTGLVVWPLLLGGSTIKVWCIPVAVLFVSCGWWENYVNKQSHIGKSQCALPSLHAGLTSEWFTTALVPLSAGFIKSMGRIKERLKRTRYFTYIFISVWKIVVFFTMMLVITFFIEKDLSVSKLFSLMPSAFSDRKITITEVRDIYLLLCPR